MPQIMWEYFMATDICHSAQLFHGFPYVTAIQGLSGLCDKDASCFNIQLSAVFQKLLSELCRKKDISCFAFIMNCCFSAL